jgi:hypothetical protein
MSELNQRLSTINRVVVHPKYRTIGLGVKLIRETLPLVGTDVEMVAVMAKYSPFAEKAGMRRVVVQEPWKGTLRISEVLLELGFDLKLLGSQRYVKEKLLVFTPEHVHTLREAFARNPHPRFKKEVCALRHLPWGSLSAYTEGVKSANLEKLARFVKVTGMLLQTKVYLFWKSSRRRARTCLVYSPFSNSK